MLLKSNDNIYGYTKHFFTLAKLYEQKLNPDFVIGDSPTKNNLLPVLTRFSFVSSSHSINNSN